MDADPELGLDEVIVGSLATAVETLGVGRYLEAPQVSFDERCFPDPWEPSLRGVRTVLRRLMRHVRLPDVPVVVEDLRMGAEPEGLLHNPVLFDGIEEGAAYFTVAAIGAPRLMVTWLALEVVRAWAEYHGVTGGRAGGYREPASDEAEPSPQPDSLGDGLTTVFGVALGLGPLFACGTVQTHKSERLVGSFVEARWATQTVGVPPPALTRLLAVHALSRGVGPEEIAELREALDEDFHRVLDATLAELADDVSTLREALGLPATPTLERAALDLSPLPAEDDVALVGAEREHEERTRFFNRGHDVHAVIGHHAGLGVAGGMALSGLLLVLAIKGGLPPMFWVVSTVVCIVGGGVWGHRQTFLRCSDLKCWGRIGPKDATCPACGGTVVGQLRSADDRFANEE